MNRFDEINQNPQRLGRQHEEVEYFLVFAAVLEEFLVSLKGVKFEPEKSKPVTAFLDMVKSKAESGKTLGELARKYKHFLETE